MGEDEAATLATLTTYRDVFAQLIVEHKGRLVDTAGDSVLAIFDSVVEAVECAAQVQQTLHARNQALPQTRRMEFRVGVNLGDVIEQADGSVYGDGVNLAARRKRSRTLRASASRVRPTIRSRTRSCSSPAEGLNFSGKPGEALEHARRSMRLDPNFPFYVTFILGSSYFLLRQYDPAIAAYQEASHRNADFLPAHALLATAYSELGREQEAQAEAAELLRIMPGFSL